jgi:hypothetical protein
MRIFISSAVGLGIGAFFLVNVLGWVAWCPSGVFMVLHYPFMLLACAVFPGESGFWDSLPFLTLQWPMVGGLVGLVLHIWHKSANPALQRTPGSTPVPNADAGGPAPLS